MPSNDYLMLRSALRAHLEARTASLQLIFRCVDQFPDSLESGGPGPRATTLAPRVHARGRFWVPAFAGMTRKGAAPNVKFEPLTGLHHVRLLASTVPQELAGQGSRRLAVFKGDFTVDQDPVV